MDLLSNWNDEEIILVDKNKTIRVEELKAMISEICASPLLLAKKTVGVYCNNSTELIALLLALLSLRCKVVMLNRRLTSSELEYQLRVAGCELVISDSSIAVETEIVRIEDLFGGKQGPCGHVDLDAVSFVLFTSGTTGRPKGVQLTLRNFMKNAEASKERLELRKGDVWLLNLPVFHVGGLAIIFRAMFLHLGIVLLEKFTEEDTAKLARQHGVNIMSLVPTMLHRLIAAGHGTTLQRMKVILVGGARTSRRLIEESEKLNLNLHTTYGMTEVCSQIATATPQDVYLHNGTSGKPLQGLSVWIDSRDQPVGEICVSGDMVMKGYIGHPETKIHRTGDFGYLDDEGRVYVLARRTDLIVSGGENIYPAEVEELLLEVEGVENACVIGVPDDEWGEKVVAIIEGTVQSFGTIKARLKCSLAGYKIPRRIGVAAIPRTASGKISRKGVSSMVEQNSDTIIWLQ